MMWTLLGKLYYRPVYKPRPSWNTWRHLLRFRGSTRISVAPALSRHHPRGGIIKTDTDLMTFIDCINPGGSSQINYRRPSWNTWRHLLRFRGSTRISVAPALSRHHPRGGIIKTDTDLMTFIDCINPGGSSQINYRRPSWNTWRHLLRFRGSTRISVAPALSR